MMSNISRAAMGWREIEWRQVAWFLLPALPFTALGALGFALVDKSVMTRVLCSFLIVFAVMKLMGKMQLPKSRATMLIGGGLTGFINGMMGISGPLSSAVFLTLNLSPVAYIVSEATAAAAMHVVKAVTYGRFDLMNWHIFINGFFIGCAMMAGNFIALRLIRYAHRKTYQRIVAGVMIAVSLWLIISS